MGEKLYNQDLEPWALLLFCYWVLQSVVPPNIMFGEPHPQERLLGKAARSFHKFLEGSPVHPSVLHQQRFQFKKNPHSCTQVTVCGLWGPREVSGDDLVLPLPTVPHQRGSLPELSQPSTEKWSGLRSSGGSHVMWGTVSIFSPGLTPLSLSGLNFFFLT